MSSIDLILEKLVEIQENNKKILQRVKALESDKKAAKPENDLMVHFNNVQKSYPNLSEFYKDQLKKSGLWKG